MGHIRLGVLPKKTPWMSIMRQFADADTPVSDLSNTVLDNTDELFASKASQICVGYCVWLLAQLTQAAKKDDFISSLDELGIYVREEAKATEFLARIAGESSKRLSSIEPRTAINNIAGLALRETLTHTVGLYANTLFNTGVDDIQNALRKYSTQRQFSNLLHLFFASFISRTLRFVFDKEIANQVGPGKRFENIQELEYFERELETFANQTARMIDTFSGGWYSKKLWQQGEISKFDAEKFVNVALKKLRSDLELNEVS